MNSKLSTTNQAEDPSNSQTQQCHTVSDAHLHPPPQQTAVVDHQTTHQTPPGFQESQTNHRASSFSSTSAVSGGAPDNLTPCDGDSGLPRREDVQPAQLKASMGATAPMISKREMNSPSSHLASASASPPATYNATSSSGSQVGSSYPALTTAAGGATAAPVQGYATAIDVEDFRKSVIDVLALGRERRLLDESDYSQRLQTAFRSSSLEELQALIGDLQAIAEELMGAVAISAFVTEEEESARQTRGGAAAGVSTPTAFTSTVRGRAGGHVEKKGGQKRSASFPSTHQEEVKGRQTYFSIMGLVHKNGEFTAPRRMYVGSVMGCTNVNLKEAKFLPGETKLYLASVGGVVRVTVPPHIDVISSGINVMGLTSNSAHSKKKKNKKRTGRRFEGGAMAREDAKSEEESDQDEERPVLKIVKIGLMGLVFVHQSKE